MASVQETLLIWWILDDWLAGQREDIVKTFPDILITTLLNISSKLREDFKNQE